MTENVVLWCSEIFPYLFAAKVLKLKHARLSKRSFPILKRSWGATINSANFISKPERQKYSQKGGLIYALLIQQLNLFRYLNAVTLRNLNKSHVTLLKLIAASSKDFSINRQNFFFSRKCFLWQRFLFSQMFFFCVTFCT